MRSRLGRGLSSLISVSVEPPVMIGDLPPQRGDLPASGAIDAGHLEIPLTNITANPSQPRRSFDDALISQLAESLKTSGLIQPIVVRPIEGGYQLIAGERRLRAARLAGFVNIPAVGRNVDYLPQAQLSLVEKI